MSLQQSRHRSRTAGKYGEFSNHKGAEAVSDKRSLILYHDIREPLELLSDSDRGRLFLAVLDYSEFSKLPEFDGALKMAFVFIRQSIDRDSEKWGENMLCAFSGSAAKAGAPKGNQNARKNNQNNQLVKKQAKQTDNVPVPVPVPVNKNIHSCAEPQSDSTPKGSLPLNNGTEFFIYEDDISRWESLYPAVNVKQELRNMLGWCEGSFHTVKDPPWN